MICAKSHASRSPRLSPWPANGCNVWAALQMARRLGPGRRLVTVIVDSGLKYLQGDLFR